MSSSNKRVATAVLAAITMAGSTAALATNGYFTHGVGAQSKGMAGTGVGSNAFSGPIIVASNPALGVFANDSWEVGLSFFSPRRSYEAFQSQLNGQFGSFTVGEGKIDSSSEWFPIPYVAKNWRLANDNAVTFLFYGRGGMNTDWDDSNASATSLFCDPTGQAVTTGPGPFCAGDGGVDLSQAFLSVNYSAQVSDNFSWGIGPVIAIQAFEAKGVTSFTPITETFATSIVGGGGPVPADNLSNNGHEISFGWGVAAGLWWGISDTVGFGLAYQSKLSMSELDDYADLFAEQGGFDIPSSIKAGLSFGATDTLRVNLDVEHTAFSDVDAVGNPMINILGCPTTASPQNPNPNDLTSCLGGNNGAGFGWEDMTTYKLGFEWHSDDTNVWRFGYSYGEQPIQPENVLFNILAPGVMEQHITFGYTRKRSDGGAWNFSLMYAPSSSVTGPNFFDPTQQIKLEMDQLEFEFSFLW